MHLFSERLHDCARDIWGQSLQHPFLIGIRDGSLDPKRFMFYLKQDYVYLIEYAKLFAIAGTKAKDVETMSKLAGIFHSTLSVEMGLHRHYASRFGVSLEELEATKPTPTTLGYTTYMLSGAQRGSLAWVIAALLPCMWHYREIGENFAKVPGALDHPLYREWILMYSSEKFGALTEWTIALLNRLTEGLPETELAELEECFVIASKYEYMFWDMAWRGEEWPV